MSKTVRVGADPELFMFDHGSPISAYNRIPGDKENPFPVDKGAVQVDGMALEFNIHPASSEDEFVTNLNTVMSELRNMVPNFDVLPVPVAEFGEDYINMQPEAATVLGCTPDYDAWKDGYVNDPPNAKLPFRTGAGHVHVGWVDSNDASIYDDDHITDCCNRIKQLDFYLGLPSLFYDKAVKRREMYGKPGCFRPKSYGAEYRVLSNAWLASDGLKRWVFRNTQVAMAEADAGRFAHQRIPRTIMNNMMNPNPDLRRVRQVLDKLNIEIPEYQAA